MNSLNLVGVCMQTTHLNYMPQILYQCLAKETFVMICKQLVTMQFLKHSRQFQQVLFNGWTKYQDVIQVYSHAVHQVQEHHVHQSLKGIKGVAQAC